MSDFTPVSRTGQTQTLGGYGLGHYGEEGYGEGDDVAVDIVVVTTWTAFTTR